MNYLHHYQQLIRRARGRTIGSNIYRERHHVIPKCMGGNDAPDNLVELTAEEHYIAHQLLHKIYPDNKGLLLACFAMAMSNDTTIRNNKLYGWIRRKSFLLSSKRVSINGVTYDSIKIASRTLSVIEPVIRKRCRATEYPDWVFIDTPCVKTQQFVETMGNIRVTIDGQIFKSIKSAAKFYGIDHSSVKNRCHSSKYPTWNFSDIIITKSNDRGLTNSDTSIRITVDGVIYPSLYKTSKHFTIDITTVNLRCLSPNFPNWNFTDNPRKNPISVKEKRLCIDGITYASLKLAASALGVSSKTVRARCTSEKFPTYHYIDK